MAARLMPAAKCLAGPGTLAWRLNTDERPAPIMKDFEFRRVADFPGQIEQMLERRKERVALYFAFDQREVKVGAAWQQLPVDFRAAADEDVVGEFGRVQLLQRIENENLRAAVSAQFGEI